MKMRKGPSGKRVDVEAWSDWQTFEAVGVVGQPVLRLPVAEGGTDYTLEVEAFAFGAAPANGIRRRRYHIAADPDNRYDLAVADVFVYTDGNNISLPPVNANPPGVDVAWAGSGTRTIRARYRILVARPFQE